MTPRTFTPSDKPDRTGRCTGCGSDDTQHLCPDPLNLKEFSMTSPAAPTLTLQQRYDAGEFGPVGSPEAQAGLAKASHEAVIHDGTAPLTAPIDAEKGFTDDELVSNIDAEVEHIKSALNLDDLGAERVFNARPDRDPWAVYVLQQKTSGRSYFNRATFASLSAPTAPPSAPYPKPVDPAPTTPATPSPQSAVPTQPTAATSDVHTTIAAVAQAVSSVAQAAPTVAAQPASHPSHAWYSNIVGALTSLLKTAAPIALAAVAANNPKYAAAIGAAASAVAGADPS